MTLYFNTLFNPLPLNPVDSIYNESPDTRSLVDLQNNTVQDARLIDLDSGDYVVNQFGSFCGMDAVMQSVELVLFTTFGSAAAPFGQTFKEVKLITPTIQTQMMNIVTTALAYQLNNNLVQIIQLNVVKNVFNQIEIALYWKNLQTGQTLMTNAPASN